MTNEKIQEFLSNKYSTTTESWSQINSYVREDNTLMYVYENKQYGVASLYFSNEVICLFSLDEKENYLFLLNLEQRFNSNMKKPEEKENQNNIKPHLYLSKKEFDVSHIKKIETAHCKEYLKETFPETETKEWKRKTKYKNSNKENVREFEHPAYGIIILTESQSKLVIEAKDNNSNTNTNINKKNGFIFAYQALRKRKPLF